jgi:hypothetical protein
MGTCQWLKQLVAGPWKDANYHILIVIIKVFMLASCIVCIIIDVLCLKKKIDVLGASCLKLLESCHLCYE